MEKKRYDMCQVTLEKKISLTESGCHKAAGFGKGNFFALSAWWGRTEK